jgi:DNA-binding beta-propeller fold protein YncE
VEQEFGPPASGNRYVYVPLTDLDTVARVDSETLDVESLVVGDRPTVLVTAPGQDLAVVLNTGSDSVSILRTEAGVDRVVTLPTPPHFNRLVVGPLGMFAVSYFVLESPDTQGIGSFQDVSVIRLAENQEEVLNVSVGFRPRAVTFAPDESAAYVITEDGVSILDLAGATGGFIAPTVPVSANPFVEGIPDEVVVMPDGSYAFARWQSMSMVRAVNLQTADSTDTPLGAPPTDIDLTAAGDRLVSVIRARSEIVIMDVPGDIGDASALDTLDCTPLNIGSAVLTEDGEHAIVFTNAVNEKAISVVELATGNKQTAMLRKGVRTLAIAPDGTIALILHNKIPGDPSPLDDFETQLDKRYGFSLFNLDTLFAKLQITDADPGAFAFVPDSSAAYLIVADPDQNLREVLKLNLQNLIVSSYLVGSHPVEIGSVLGTNRIYVSQDHPMGRISFINVGTGELRTVTGFQLNSQIIE